MLIKFYTLFNIKRDTQMAEEQIPELVGSDDVPKLEVSGDGSPGEPQPELITVPPELGGQEIRAAVDSDAAALDKSRAEGPPLYGGYTGIRVSRMPGARYEPGMPLGGRLTNSQSGDPNVPYLGPGDPRINQEAPPDSNL